MTQAVVPFNIPLPFLGSQRCDVDEGSDHGEQGLSLEAKQSPGGNVLQSVFGLNSQSLIKGVQGVKSTFSKSFNNVPAGLGNWDNSCYQNSVIQGLASLPSLREYLHNATTQYCILTKETTNGALFELIDALNDPKNYGRQFWIPGKLRAMSTFQQQDAQEYYSKILDGLDKEILKATDNQRHLTADWASTAKSLIDDSTKSQLDSKPTVEQTPTEPKYSEPSKALSNPLDGLLAQRVGCVKCGYSEGLSLIPFNCLTVPLGRKWAYDVRECLNEYTNLEYIEGVECAKCTLLRTKDTLTKILENQTGNLPEFLRRKTEERLDTVQQALEDDDFADNTLIKKCNVPKKNWLSTTKSRQAVIARAPKSLVIHVNRSVFDEYTGAQLKNHAQVHFPKDFDLGSWCLGSGPSDSPQCDGSTEEWSKDPTKSMLSMTDAEMQANSTFQYTLRAAVTHYGRHENGHYICYRKLPVVISEDVLPRKMKKDQEAQPTERWWRLSDEDVSAVSENEVLAQGNVFMLFYERVDDTTPSLAAPETPVVPEDIPLPPSECGLSPVLFDEDAAADVPLPTDEDDLFSAPPSPSLTPTEPSLAIEPAKEILKPSSSAIISPVPATAKIPYPTPPPEEHPASEPDSTDHSTEDWSSTQLTSDDEMELNSKPKSDPRQKTKSTTGGPNMSPGPHRMRTAADAGSRNGKGRKSLPMVAAT